MLVDAYQREVRLDRNPVRVVLGDSIDLLSLSLVHERPLESLVGWGGRRRLDAGFADAIRQDHPEIDAIADLGDPNASGFQVERALTLDPDVAIFSGGFSPDDIAVRQLEAAGVPVVFITGPEEAMPAGTDIKAAISILGTLFERQAGAGAFLAFYDERVRRLETLVSGVRDRPKVLVEAHANSADCCWTPGSSANYIERAGGDNVARSLVPGATGQVSLDFLLQTSPDVIVATGSGTVGVGDGLAIGPGVDLRTSQASLSALSRRRGFDSVADNGRRYHGIWHQLLATPYSLVALEAMAVWFHPDFRLTIDPELTLAEINDRFAALPLPGTVLVSLP
ncbi:ABC transporter substrate-binding protein [Ensifer sp.]|uniref:ABC transporter substrate-binding protein n=1 Tax=Ensifer sp. TaxID=1872086 RepID=UPI002E135970|nr:ABC transporter substrate-binding protein [Ensifer sp.]